MVAKKQLLTIRGSNGVIPLHMAALLGYEDMVWYLLSVTGSQSLTKDDYVALLIATISSDLYDVALRLLQEKQEVVNKRDPNSETTLHVQARKPSAFSGKSVSAKLWNKSGRTSTFRLLNRIMDLTGMGSNYGEKVYAIPSLGVGSDSVLKTAFGILTKTQNVEHPIWYLQRNTRASQEWIKWMKDTSSSCMLQAILVTI
ncbi:unnamed protein product [Fraxinus pennsylvanica]|uniref:Uncharacterized protein n=1 Tax=Fraxinus pennsylvanica TaxID=56036 RepID=A0AAD2E992_9LAMI|nr:unnamed protein product [Fraxinus pennsylvanica]